MVLARLARFLRPVGVPLCVMDRNKGGILEAVQRCGGMMRQMSRTDNGQNHTNISETEDGSTTIENKNMIYEVIATKSPFRARQTTTDVKRSENQRKDMINNRMGFVPLLSFFFSNSMPPLPLTHIRLSRPATKTQQQEATAARAPP